MKKVVGFLFLVLITQLSFGQTGFIAVASGNWNASGVWSTDGFTPLTCVTCVVGTHYPGATDDAMTNGFTITVNAAQQVRDFFVEDVAASVPFAGQLTVNGVMTGWSGGQFGFPTGLTNNVFSGTSRVVFTAADLSNGGAPPPFGFANFFNNEVLAMWNNNTPITVAQFNLSNPGTIDTDFGSSIIRFTQLQIVAGTLSTGFTISAIEAGQVVALTSVTSVFNSLVPIYGFSGVASSVSQVQILNGASLNLSNSTSYLNTANFILNGTSSLLVNFSGIDQTEGWWYQSNSPLTTISTTSTIEFSANANQNIPVDDYGNLNLSGSGTISKTLESIGTLKIFGDLNINSSALTFVTSGNTNPIDIGGNVDNDGVWAPTQEVIFNGSATQNIAGNNDITFGGGITISNTSATVQLLNSGMDVNGILDIDASATFSPNGEQVNLDGNLEIDGTLTASGAFVFDGTTAISGSGTKAFEDVTISNTLSAPSQTLLVVGDFANNGTFSNTNGTTTFDGINAQAISGSQAIDFNNLSITNSSAIVSNNGTVDISSSGTVTLGANATLDVDGSGAGVFTLLSTSGSASATVAELPGTAIISGDIRWQRHFDGGGDVWRNFGVAVSGATVSEITGGGFTINGNDLARYDESEIVLGTVNDGWELQSSFGANLSNTEGYSMYTRSEEMTNTITFIGALNTGTQNMSVSRNTGPVSTTDDGWNLVNNPFASTINWDLVTANNLDAFASVWDGTQYLTVGSGGDIPTGFIASGQSFWVHSTSGTPSLTIEEADKVSSSTAFLRTGEVTYQDRLIVSLSDDNYSDNTYVWFRSGATANFDENYDALKLQNDIFNLSSLALSGEELAINSIGAVAGCSESVKLNITNISEGSYNLNFEGLVSFASGLDITLVDNFLSTSEVLSEGITYTFAVTVDPLSKGDTRFELEFAAEALETNLNTSIINNCEQESISVFIDNTQIGVDYSLMSGADVVVSGTGNGGQLELHILKSLLSEGTNTYEVSIYSGACGSALADNAVTYEFVGITEVSSVTDGSICGKGSTVLSAEGAPSGGYYRWYESIDSSESISGENSADFTTPDLTASKTYFVSVVNSQGCESINKVAVNAEIKDQPAIPDGIISSIDCFGDDAIVSIPNTQIGAEYKLKVATGSVLTVVGTGDQVNISIVKSSLVNGVNNFDLTVDNGFCDIAGIDVASINYVATVEVEGVTSQSNCGKGSITIGATGAQEGDQYRWYETIDSSDPISGENMGDFITPELEESKVYFVSIVNSLGCESIERKPVNAIINELPQIPEIVEEGGVLVSSALENNQWYKDGLLIEGATNKTLEVVESGTYSVTVENSSGCRSDSESKVMTITAVLANDFNDNLLSIFPNPIGDEQLTISANQLSAYKMIQLYNSKGLLMLTKQIEVKNTIQIDMSGFSKGIYFIHLSGEDGSAVHKLLKN